MTVVGTAGSKEALERDIERIPFDILLLDLSLSGERQFEGLEISFRLRSSHPHVKTVVLSSWDDDELVEHAFIYGRVANYVTKKYWTDIPEAIREAANGRSGIHHSSTRQLVRRMSAVNRQAMLARITPKQLQIVRLLQQGFSRKEIAERLFYSEQNIHKEICEISRLLKGKFPYLAYFGLRKQNYNQLVRLAREWGLLPEEK